MAVEIRGTSTLRTRAHFCLADTKQEKSPPRGPQSGQRSITDRVPGRAEDFPEITQDQQLSAVINVYELLGAEVFLYFDIDGTEFTSRVSPDNHVSQKDRANFVLNMEKAHYFDVETEENILEK